MLKRLVHRVRWILHLPSNIAALWSSHDELAALVAKQREEIDQLQDILVEHHEWIRARSLSRSESQRLFADLQEPRILAGGELQEPQSLAGDDPHTEH